jgi:hypothetical protein
MKKLIPLLLLAMPFANQVFSQGCVSVRSINGFGQYVQRDNSFTDATWLVNVNNRFFTAHRDYKGTNDLHTAEQNENRTNYYTLDVLVTRLLNNGWSISLGIPYNANARETSAEHGGPNTPRHTTHSAGVGDIRFEVYKWILKPTATQKFNFQIGLGVKLATGDYEYKDWFYKDDTTKILGPVNPSIQLGDGGTGIISELNAYYVFGKSITAYGNFFYLANPREQNGVPAQLGWRPPTPESAKWGGDIISVPDIYAARLGVDFSYHKWILSAGARYEGVPVDDIFGGSNGVRRAGHNLSVEPGLTYSLKKVSLYTYVPVIVDRETKTINPDKIRHDKFGGPVPTPPPGGFGDYMIFVGALFKI